MDACTWPVRSPNPGACWQPREDKRQGGLDSEGLDGASHVKRRHSDVPRRRSLKNRLQAVPERAVSGSSVSGVLSANISSGRSSPSIHEDGGSSPIAGPSGFVPKSKSQPRRSKKGSPRPEESDNEAEALNSDDEYERMRDDQLTEEDWEKREEHFEKLLQKKNLVIKQMEQDGACLFRAVADQVYGDQEMHGVVRGHCMDYIVSPTKSFSYFSFGKCV